MPSARNPNPNAPRLPAAIPNPVLPITGLPPEVPMDGSPIVVGDATPVNVTLDGATKRRTPRYAVLAAALVSVENVAAGPVSTTETSALAVVVANSVTCPPLIWPQTPRQPVSGETASVYWRLHTPPASVHF